jgi:hypothetical protein
LKLSITINDIDHLDQALDLLKEELADRGDKKSGKLVHLEPHVELIGDGDSAEFDGGNFDEYELGSWRISVGERSGAGAPRPGRRTRGKTVSD